MCCKSGFSILFAVALTALANTATAATLYHGDTDTFDWADGLPGWSAIEAGPYTENWVDGNAAYFNATSGTANITSVVNVSEVEATGTAATYYIQGGELNVADGGIISCYSGRTLHVSSVISGGGENGWESPNSGDLYLEGDSANTYTGPVTFTGKTLYLGKTSGNALTGDITLDHGSQGSWTKFSSLSLNASDQIADDAVINFEPRTDGGGYYATFTLNGNNETVGGISDLSGRAVIANALVSTGGVGTLTVNNNSDCVFAGSIYNYYSGDDSSLALVKGGTATLTLSGYNTYKGNTTINSGTLELTSTGTLHCNINTSGDSTQFLGSGNLILDGTLRFTLDGVTDFGTWNAVADSLITTNTYGENFAVEFSKGGAVAAASDLDGIWTYYDETLGAILKYTEATGILSIENGTIRPGDANRDFSVDEEDARILAEHWLMSGEDIGWGDGDFNDDDTVNDIDATLMATNWGTASATASVPEPGAIAMLLIAAVSLGFLRRK